MSSHTIKEQALDQDQHILEKQTSTPLTVLEERTIVDRQPGTPLTVSGEQPFNQDNNIVDHTIAEERASCPLTVLQNFKNS